MNRLMLRAMNWADRELERIRTEEYGDTNFISMLLIIAIVVVFAGAFLVLGNGVMSSVQGLIENFFSSLGS